MNSLIFIGLLLGVIGIVGGTENPCADILTCIDCVTSEFKCVYAETKNDVSCLPAGTKSGIRAFVRRESQCEKLGTYFSKAAINNIGQQQDDKSPLSSQSDMIIAHTTTPPNTTEQEEMSATNDKMPEGTEIVFESQEVKDKGENIDSAFSTSSFSDPLPAIKKPTPTNKSASVGPREKSVRLGTHALDYTGKKEPLTNVRLFGWTPLVPFTCVNTMSKLQARLERALCRTVDHYHKIGLENLPHDILGNYYTNPATQKKLHCDFLFWVRKKCVKDI